MPTALPTLADIRQVIITRPREITYKHICKECNVSPAFAKHLGAGRALNPSYPKTVKIYEYIVRRRAEIAAQILASS
jgi:hypothetical protein